MYVGVSRSITASITTTYHLQENHDRTALLCNLETPPTFSPHQT